MKLINSKYVLLCILLTLVVTGCKVKRPKEVISESRMENLLYDYHIAKAMGENLPYNENYKKALYIEYVFKKHNTTEAVFDSSMVWYTRHTDILSKIYDKVNKRFKTQQDEINQLIAIRDKKPKTSEPGDSIDVWLLERIFRLTGTPLNNKITFSLPTDTNFKERDTLIWEANYRYLGARPDSSEAAIMAMQILYANDSTINITKRIFESGIHNIRLHSDTLGAIKEIKGFIYYTGGRDTVKHLLTDRISLMRYHSLDTLFAANDSVKTDSIKEATPKEEEVQQEVQQPTQQPSRPNPNDLRERPRPQRETVKENDIKR